MKTWCRRARSFSTAFKPVPTNPEMSSALAVKASRFAIVVALFVLWEIAVATGMVNPRLLPSASDHHRDAG